ncbi:MAG: exopolyphosphatase [Maribacter sp.]|nr:exopolyphosphatase [Maribacter sp.]
MKVRKFAAIDIGSNAIRLLTQNVIEQPNKQTQFYKNSLIRVPVRLGEDAFTMGKISAHNAERIVNTMKAFKLLMEVSEVEKYMACATSAIREAENGSQIMDDIYQQCGIHVEIIDGKREAAIIAATNLQHIIHDENSYLYIDVGGGSTEFTLFDKGKIKVSQSFQIGTVRILNKKVGEDVWQKLEIWIRSTMGDSKDLYIIGSGGNINKLHKMSGRKEGEPLTYSGLHRQYRELQGLTYEERISVLGLNPDRADVIIPATRIFLSAAKWSGAKKIYVPKIGLSDGIINALYYSV